MLSKLFKAIFKFRFIITRSSLIENLINICFKNKFLIRATGGSTGPNTPQLNWHAVHYQAIAQLDLLYGNRVPLT